MQFSLRTLVLVAPIAVAAVSVTGVVLYRRPDVLDELWDHAFIVSLALAVYSKPFAAVYVGRRVYEFAHAKQKWNAAVAAVLALAASGFAACTWLAVIFAAFTIIVG